MAGLPVDSILTAEWCTLSREGRLDWDRNPACGTSVWIRRMAGGQMVPGAPRIAVLIPCFNEAATIADVVSEFRRHLPSAEFYVYDNNSTDGTAEAARRAGAVVRSETQQGKGHVVRRMFADIEADIFVLVDGDGTYDASAAPPAIDQLVAEELDMITIAREMSVDEAFRPGHRLGNVALTELVRWIFGSRIKDMLSGYRVLSRRFVKSFPALAQGFETETELTVHALELNMPIGERLAPYRERPEGSESKLNTFRDGFRILGLIIVLMKEERPIAFFGTIGWVLTIVATALGIPVVIEYVETGLVPRFPTAILATGTMLLGFLSHTCGLILDSVTRARRETRRLFYLATPRSITAPMEVTARH